MNSRMKDRLLDATRLKSNVFMNTDHLLSEIRRTINLEYRIQFMPRWDWDGIADADKIAEFVRKEVMLELSVPVGLERIGDNGPDDVGYELKWHNGGEKQIEIGIIKSSLPPCTGVGGSKWRVIIAKDGIEIPVGNIDELMKEVNVRC